MHDGVALADRARQQTPEASIELLYVCVHRARARHPIRRLGDHPVLHRQLIEPAEYLGDALHERPRLERERQVAGRRQDRVAELHAVARGARPKRRAGAVIGGVAQLFVERAHAPSLHQVALARFTHRSARGSPDGQRLLKRPHRERQALGGILCRRDGPLPSALRQCSCSLLVSGHQPLDNARLELFEELARAVVPRIVPIENLSGIAEAHRAPPLACGEDGLALIQEPRCISVGDLHETGDQIPSEPSGVRDVPRVDINTREHKRPFRELVEERVGHRMLQLHRAFEVGRVQRRTAIADRGQW